MPMTLSSAKPRASALTSSLLPTASLIEEPLFLFPLPLYSSAKTGAWGTLVVALFRNNVLLKAVKRPALEPEMAPLDANVCEVLEREDL
jgi:hypothetical protein